jgi:hypothetical protein
MSLEVSAIERSRAPCTHRLDVALASMLVEAPRHGVLTLELREGGHVDAVALAAGIYIGGGVVLLIVIILVLVLLFR